MKKSINTMNLLTDGSPALQCVAFEPYEDNEITESEENNFYFPGGSDNHNELGEMIKSWESSRYLSYQV